MIIYYNDIYVARVNFLLLVLNWTICLSDRIYMGSIYVQLLIKIILYPEFYARLAMTMIIFYSHKRIYIHWREENYER